MIYEEPVKKRVVAFFDSQNLFKSVKKLWGYSHPNFNPIELSKLLVAKYAHQGWVLVGIRVYTGIHSPKISPAWHNFWVRKLAVHSNQDSRVRTFTRLLQYSDGIPREKGIDVRIALDLVRMARLNEYDVALLFSQDNDFAEVADEIRDIAREKRQWLKIVTAFPCDSASKMSGGIRKTDWIRIQKPEYDACIDTSDYRSDFAGSNKDT